MTEFAVGPYKVLRKLGSGGMGEVFLCRDTRLHRQVALKSLTTSDFGSADLRERILREGRAAARLNHPHIAAVYDIVEHDGRAFIVMEYVEGESLANRLARDNFPLPVDEVVTIGRHLASALAAAHAHGVVHRDLKPGNIQVTPDGSIKVLDFGIARVAPPIPSATATTATVTGLTPPTPDVAGTPLYMAPEQLLGREADARSDIYSAGVVLFEMATGRRPYLERDPFALAVGMSTTAAPAAQLVNPAVPTRLSRVIARALEREPDRRYQSAAEAEAALADANRGHIGRWRRWGLVTAGVLLLALGVSERERLLTTLGLSRVPPVTGPTVLAILPVETPAGDSGAEQLAVEVASLVIENLGAAPGVTAVSRMATADYGQRRNDLAGIARDLHATFVLDLAFTRAAPSPAIQVRLRRPDVPEPDWEQTIEGEPVEVERQLLDGIARAFGRARVWPGGLSKADRARISKLPTDNGQALLDYLQARTLLDRSDVTSNVDAAIDLLQRAAASDPQFVAAQAALGDSYWSKYSTSKDPALVATATAAVMKAVRAAPDEAEVHYSLGNMHYLTGRPEDAESSLRRAIARRPDHDGAHRRLGQVLADRGDLEAGVAEIEQSIRIRPQYWGHHAMLGFVYYRAARYSDALHAYRRAADLQPADAGLFTMLGTTQYRLGDIDSAVGNYEHAVRLGPNPAAYANLALAYYTRKRYTEALNAYQQSLALSPKLPLNHRNIGDVYMRLEQPANARAAYEQAISVGNELLAVNARDYRTIGLIALCEAKLGRVSSAERHAAEARTLAPEDREVLQRSAEVHALLGNTAAALRDLTAAIERGYTGRAARENDELVRLWNLPAFKRLTGETAADR